MKQKILSFEWDKGNIRKCQKHGLAIETIEHFFKSNELYITPDIKHSDKELRYLAIGRVMSGRLMFVAFTLRNNKIRPISARYMHIKEIRAYEKEITKI